MGIAGTLLDATITERNGRAKSREVLETKTLVITVGKGGALRTTEKVYTIVFGHNVVSVEMGHHSLLPTRSSCTANIIKSRDVRFEAFLVIYTVQDTHSRCQDHLWAIAIAGPCSMVDNCI